jgi:hypothetical protein
MVVAAACAFLAWQLLVSLPELPDRFVSKFAFDGAPRSLGSKALFAWIVGSIATLMVVAFAAIGLVRRASGAYSNDPQRDQKLAPEQRAAAIEDVVGTVRSMLAGSVVFLAVTTWLVIEANRSSPAKLSSGFFVLLVIYVAGMIATAWRLHLRGRKLAVG